MQQKTIAFIGSGNMAQAIISGLLNSGYPEHSIIATGRSEEKLAKLEEKYKISVTTDNLKAAEQANVIVLAVKPQMMKGVCEQLASVDLSSKLIITIAAGILSTKYPLWTQQALQLVRVMPNTPSLIGKGLSGLYANDDIAPEWSAFAESLMASVGDICWVKHESGINNIIAAAGSAPAYFFYFMESIEKQAIEQGFTPEMARKIVTQVALGSAHMVSSNPSTPISTLREQVTSKGGTTAEALAVFEQQQLCDIVATAMKAAVTRAEEMQELF